MAISWKNLTQKNLTKKKFKIIFREMFLNFFLCLRPSTSNLESACKNLGGLGPLVWEEIDTAQTVHKGLAKLLYRYGSNHVDVKV
jgi:hypothetical protein